MRAPAVAIGLFVVACGPAGEGARVPPVTSAGAKPTDAVAAPPPKAGSGGSPYAGHGAESVPPEVIARYAPTPLATDVSRRIQAMLDVRAPVGSRIAPDGSSVYFAWNVTGTAQVWKADGPRRFPLQLTGGEDVTRLVGITPDGKWLVVSRDRKGEENPGLYLLAADNGGALREVQHKAKVQTQLEYVSDDGKYLYFRSNDVKIDSYAIYKWEIATGKRELVFGEPGLWSIADHTGTKLLLAKATGALTSELSAYDEASKTTTPLFGQNEKEEYDVAYGAAPGELLVQTPKFGDFRRLYRTKPSARSGKPLAAADVIAVTPDVKHDVASFFIDRPRTHVYYTTNEGGFTRAHVLDGKTYAEQKLPEVKDAVHTRFGTPTWNGRFVTVNVSTAKAPTTSYVFDWQTQKLVQWVMPSTPEIDTSKFAVASLETYPARDGTKIPMFVRRPPGCNVAALCPVVVSFHGGPEGQSLPGFHAFAQLFVDAGFVFVEPNVRGSDGYGKAWLHADDGPKRLQVVSDIEDASKYVRSAWAHEGKAPKVGITGGSYGGYSTLIGMTKFAGAYDAGVANVGMSNLLSFLLNTAPYRRALRASEYGDPEKDREALLELSPITHIARVNAPLMLIQGASDPRVPVGEAIQMHDALEKRGVATKLMVFPDEGHGAQKRENKVLEIGHTLSFFEATLKK
ncbi:MAG: Acylamino-acid-releasing enzyme [Labilithrix sp.]|nr:Acylamino-acid-releasing enzyme [Labilithrix sp.]